MREERKPAVHGPGGERALLRWLARLEPVLDSPRTLDAGGCRERLARLSELRAEAGAVIGENAAGGELPAMARQAAGELDTVEARLRGRLGELAPGDPEALPDLESIRERLAVLAARREVDGCLGPGFRRRPEPFSAVTHRPEWGVALFLAVFGSAWTAVALTLMARLASEAAPGLSSLLTVPLVTAALLCAGLAGLAGAAAAMCRERLEITGGELVLSRRWGCFSRTLRGRLAPGARAYLPPGFSGVAVMTGEGEEVRFAADADRSRIGIRALAAAINGYLDRQEGAAAPGRRETGKGMRKRITRRPRGGPGGHAFARGACGRCGVSETAAAHFGWGCRRSDPER